MFLAVMDLPPPLSRNAYSENLRETFEIVNLQTYQQPIQVQQPS